MAIKRADNNLYDLKDVQFYQTIKDGYLKIAQDNPKRIVVIDGNKNCRHPG